MRIFGYYIGIVELLISITVLIFLASLTNWEFFILNFGLIPSIVLDNPWSIVTSMFLHGGFSHIMFNMLALFFLGMYLERLIGENNFIKVYFLGGISASLFAIIVSYLGLTNPDIPVVGASGAIFAVGATLAILKPNLQVILIPIPFPMPLYVAVFGFMVLISFLPGISWAGHLGGLLAGIIFGYYFKKKGATRGDLFGEYRYGFRF